MRKKYRKIVVLVFFAITSATSCNKYLNLEPINATYDEVFWVNGSNVEKALSGAYGMLRNAFRLDRSYFITGDLAGDNFLIGGDLWNYTSFRDEGGLRFSNASYLEGSVHNWTRFYAIVNQCNLIIENIGDIDSSLFSGGETQKQRFEGEARFLRAYTYFYMVRTWGDPILVKESFADPGNVPSLGRSPEAEALDFCLTDLNRSLELLDNNSSSTHANLGAVQALLAQIYAWRHDYQNAERYCDEVINSGTYALEDIQTYKNIWRGNSRENIFELFMQFDPVSNEATDGFFNVFLTEPYVRNRQIAAVFHIGDHIRNLFVESDLRYPQIIEPVFGESAYILVKYDNVDYYDPNNVNTYVVSNNLVLLRLADIILLRSEARFKNGNEGGALSDLNTIKSRAGLGDFTGGTQSLFEEILDERRRELIGEGTFAYDAIRMEQLQRLFPNSYTASRIAQKGYYWPLDLNALLPQAPLLTQNEVAIQLLK
ncbi:RagB/SusD family nutrient uptake outer membrane protein [Olivibacter sp. XZL3]|uniref:RagB/SusD family nutrient uptake outer membrane protein n=1 Tax=Olivibacter sp. XZL3 TaxID=1735116 RepID=UPI0010653117|nr:RagB/SusD family nutrient uptake outer membrane protein [Olivibacter sp. XZL3]